MRAPSEVDPVSTGVQPYVPAHEESVAEFTLKAIVLGSIFGVLFGASTVYLALKAGLTVSASIPIAVLAISIGKRLFKTTILENNIIQTCGSAGESVAAGVVFTLPAFLFLSDGIGTSYFQVATIMMIATFGGILGTLMMIPLRRPLIVAEHKSLPYPEGTACAQVLIAGEKGGSLAATAFMGLGFAAIYAFAQKLFEIIAETPRYVTSAANKYLPSASVAGEITPEYMGVGYIIGPKIGGVLVAGGVMAAFALTPLIATLVPMETIAAQLTKLGMVPTSDSFGWDADTKSFKDTANAIYRAYIRQIGAGAVAAAGFLTLLKTMPTIVASFTEALRSLLRRDQSQKARTERDLSVAVVVLGSLGLITVMSLLPGIPGDSITNKVMIGVLVIIFGFLFVTVASRIVGLIGSSNSPISGMTIATIMGTALVFIGIGWTGTTYEPMALVVGSLVCIAAANAGATSQDLKTGYLVGATPMYQQLALFIGVAISSLVIGFTVTYLDTPTPEMVERKVMHAIGETYNAPQATLMATLIKGLLSFNLDWQFVLAGCFLAITMELCGVKALSFAVGLYLPLATTLPIFIGGLIRGAADSLKKRQAGGNASHDDDELGKGSLFATGLVAGGALAGVVFAILAVNSSFKDFKEKLVFKDSLSEKLAPMMESLGVPSASAGSVGYQLLGVLCFAFMGLVLFTFARRK